MMFPSQNSWFCVHVATASAMVLGVLFASSQANLLVSGFQTVRPVHSSPLTVDTGVHKTFGRHPEKRQHRIQRHRWEQKQRCNSREGSSTSLNSFMGSDGGLFGIGTPELVREFWSGLAVIELPHSCSLSTFEFVFLFPFLTFRLNVSVCTDHIL